MTSLGVIQHVRNASTWRLELGNTLLLVSVERNKQYDSKHSPEEEYVQGVVKNQLITEYEFYNYMKQRIKVQVKNLPNQSLLGQIFG